MNKNRKGEITTGVMIITFLAVIVGLILLSASTPFIGQATGTGITFVKNVSITPATGVGSIVILTGGSLSGTPQVNNHSGAALPINIANYSIGTCVRSTDGLKGICYTRLKADAAITTVNVSYTYYPDGYAEDGATRSIISLITIFACLAVAIFVLVPIIKDKFGGM